MMVNYYIPRYLIIIIKCTILLAYITPQVYYTYPNKHGDTVTFCHNSNFALYINEYFSVYLHSYHANHSLFLGDPLSGQSLPSSLQEEKLMLNY